MPRPLSASLLALSLAVAAPGTAQTVAITGGTVYPVSGPPIERGTVLVRDGKIAAVGASVTVPADAQRIDATGKIVTPGLVNAATSLGITEIGAVPATRNQSARGLVRATSASVMIAPARAAGITSVLIAPQGGLLSGQAAILQLIDGTAAEMILRSPVAMVGQIENPQPIGAQSRGELLLRLREVLDDARTYQRRKAEFERAQTRTFAATRLDLEALAPVILMALRNTRSPSVTLNFRIALLVSLSMLTTGSTFASGKPVF